MRTLLTALFLFSFTAPAAAAGAYASHAAADAAACARLCADDGLCMVWTFRDGGCELRATAPSGPQPGILGFSARAPGALRQSFVNQAPAPPAPTPLRVEADEQPPAPATETAPEQVADGNVELLGGPDVAETALRPRLGLRN